MFVQKGKLQSPVVYDILQPFHCQQVHMWVVGCLSVFVCARAIACVLGTGVYYGFEWVRVLGSMFIHP